jgi:hypothetical protein
MNIAVASAVELPKPKVMVMEQVAICILQIVTFLPKIDIAPCNRFLRLAHSSR